MAWGRRGNAALRWAGIRSRDSLYRAPRADLSSPLPTPPGGGGNGAAECPPVVVNADRMESISSSAAPPIECRFASERAAHVCRDANGEPIPAGSPKVCFSEARAQIHEMEAEMRLRRVIDGARP